MIKTISIAYFISYHGFGHASRAAAVMAAIERLLPNVRFELFTNCPPHLFNGLGWSHVDYFNVQTDIGVVQTSPFKEDVEATFRKLDAWIPFRSDLINSLVDHLHQRNCELAICDISPLGIAAAEAADIPSVLIENFTWDFIYEFYFKLIPELETPSRYLKKIFAQADMHIQTDPLCRRSQKALLVAPIGRMPKNKPEMIRKKLNVPLNEKMVLVSMGGVADQHRFLERLPAGIDPWIVVPNAGSRQSHNKKVILLSTHSDYYHPDLLQAADVLIGKAGYSTIAEVVYTGIPFGYIARPQSPETPALKHFITDNLSSFNISKQAFNEGLWIDMLSEMFKLPRSPVPAENGADEAARIICNQFFPQSLIM